MIIGQRLCGRAISQKDRDAATFEIDPGDLATNHASAMQRGAQWTADMRRFETAPRYFGQHWREKQSIGLAYQNEFDRCVRSEEMLQTFGRARSSEAAPQNNDVLASQNARRRFRLVRGSQRDQIA